MTTEYTLEEIENVTRAWTNEYASTRGWETQHLTDPVEDLTLFFQQLSGPRILDAGCGWGRYVFRFLDEGLSYHGIDYAKEMLAIAREANPEAQFTEGNFRTLPFPSEHFDGIWSCCALAAFPKEHLVATLREHYRVLKTGGVMMVVMPMLGISDEELYRDDTGAPDMYQAYYVPEELEDHLVSAHFAIVESDIRCNTGSFFVLVRKL